jgi:hypothetical protein
MSDTENINSNLKKDENISSEFTGPGSAYQVIKQYEKGLYDKSGYKPVIIKPIEVEKKNKNRLN